MTKKCSFTIAVLLLVILGGGYKFLIKGSTIAGTDGRVVILLDPEERNYILKEMRGLLGHMQQLIHAIAENDSDSVRKIADTLVQDSSGKTPARIIAKMPLAFKKISFNIHNDFKDLQAMAAQEQAPTTILKQVAKIMQNCLACHASHSLAPKINP